MKKLQLMNIVSGKLVGRSQPNLYMFYTPTSSKTYISLVGIEPMTFAISQFSQWGP